MNKVKQVMKNSKNVINYIILIFIYIILWIYLYFYYLVRNIKNFIIFQLFDKFELFKKTKWLIYNFTLDGLLKKKDNFILNIVGFFKNRKDKKKLLKTRINKIPKHIYIVFKTNDIIILNETKFIKYIIDIIIYLYEHQVQYLTIYISNQIFNWTFYETLIKDLYEHNYFTKVNNYSNIFNDKPQNCSEKLIEQFVITKFAPIGKKIPFSKREKYESLKNKFKYEQFSIYLKFMNKTYSHEKLIDIAEKNTVISKGVLVSDNFNSFNTNIEHIIKKVFYLDHKNMYHTINKTRFINFVHNLFNLFIVSKDLLVDFLKEKFKFFKLNKHLSQFFVRIYKTVVILFYSVLKLLKDEMRVVKKTNNEINIFDKFDFKTEQIEETNFILKIFENSIVDNKHLVESIKILIKNNIPLYVKPTHEDIFQDGCNELFNDVSVDIVLSLRIGLIDYFVSTFRHYKTTKQINKKNILNFVLEYFSSFFFIYNIIHPFQKNGIQPWVLSFSELYEFFGYDVKSVHKALSYYNNSMQRYGS
ncbi:hypothetical protein, variant [Plasmodium yoelii 17X]|uniref:Uncharacterized protein n=1 Tax=Plasmodium yoelii 17X TaxID=1323249 RepID=V7PCM6_PLAYE|nr:hypothetical protein YYC_05381 [Plasmodium yoelii 17X]ETB56528.1 hypothetical protein, variant [Plasmodium yoelii 17X]